MTVDPLDRVPNDLEGLADFERLVGPRSRDPEGPETGVRAALSELLRDAIGDRAIVSDAVLGRLRANLRRLDSAIGAQLDAILHHPDFQAIESTWRSLHGLVAEAEQGVLVRCMDVARAELPALVCDGATGTWRSSALARCVADRPFENRGEWPLWILVADFELGPDDARTLDAIARTSALAGTPFVAGAAPSIASVERWSDLADVGTDGLAALRATAHTAWLGLVAPRVLLRLPYGPDTDPVESIDFTEDTEGGAIERLCWGNAAFAYATIAIRAFVAHGTCVVPGGSEVGVLTALPMFTVATDEVVVARGPTDAAFTERQVRALDALGVMCLNAPRDQDRAMLTNTGGLHRAAVAPSAADVMPASFAHALAVAPFALVLRLAARDAIPQTITSVEHQLAEMRSALARYVLPPEAPPTDGARAAYPLAAVRIALRDGDEPGVRTVTLRIAPWHLIDSAVPVVAMEFDVPAR